MIHLFLIDDEYNWRVHHQSINITSIINISIHSRSTAASINNSIINNNINNNSINNDLFINRSNIINQSSSIDHIINISIHSFTININNNSIFTINNSIIIINSIIKISIHSSRSTTTINSSINQHIDHHQHQHQHQQHISIITNSIINNIINNRSSSIEHISIDIQTNAFIFCNSLKSIYLIGNKITCLNNSFSYSDFETIKMKLNLCHIKKEDFSFSNPTGDTKNNKKKLKHKKTNLIYRRPK